MNRGKELKKILKLLDIKLKHIAPILNKNEVYIYQLLNKKDLSWEIINKIGTAIKYDFSKDFPEMPLKSDYNSIINTDFSDEDEFPLELQVRIWKSKYYQLRDEILKKDKSV